MEVEMSRPQPPDQPRGATFVAELQSEGGARPKGGSKKKRQGLFGRAGQA